MPPSRNNTPGTALSGSLSLQRESRIALATVQVQLLEAIAETGSITAAAKRVGISYKTAWDRVDAINNAAEQPLVQRSAGGRRGRVARITRGAVNSDVVVDLGAGKSISAIITNPGLEQLALREGDPVCAFFKASSVILPGEQALRSQQRR